MYLPLNRVWGGVCVQLGLVEGMWDLKSVQTRVQIPPLLLTGFLILGE